MADILSKKATVKNITGTNPIMIHPISGTITIAPGQEYTGEFPLGEIAAMEKATQYDVKSSAKHESAEPDADNQTPTPDAPRKLTKAEKAAAAAQAPAGLPAAPVLPAAPGLPSALKLPGAE